MSVPGATGNAGENGAEKLFTILLRGRLDCVCRS